MATSAPSASAGASSRAAARSPFVFASCVLLVGLAALAFIYGKGLARAPIRSDAVGYYFYLPSLLIHRDVSFARTVEASFGGTIGVYSGVRPYQGGPAYLDKYPAGVAVCLLPFFAAGALAAWLGGWPMDGFSPPFQVAAALGGLAWAALGSWALIALLRRHVASSPAVLAALAAVFGTSAFHYATYDAVFSHAFSFALLALIMLLTERLYERAAWRDVLLAGALTGLALLVRPTNGLFLLFPALYGLVSSQAVVDRLRFLWRYRGRLAAGAGVAAAVAFLQPLYWFAVTGRFLIDPYPGERFDFAHPHLLEVLFSVRKGLFVWAPVLLLAVGGLPLLWRRFRAWALPVLLYLPLHTYVVASWRCWWFGGSFGHRAFVEAVPAFALGLAALLASLKPRAQQAVAVPLLLLTGWTINLMVAYWQRRIPFDKTTWEILARALGLG